MLASTMQISNNNPTNTHTPTPNKLGTRKGRAKGGPEQPTRTADPSGPNSVLILPVLVPDGTRGRACRRFH